MERQNENTDSSTLLQHSVIAVVRTEISVSLNSPLIKVCQVADVFIQSHLSHENDDVMCNFFTSSAFWRKRPSLFTSNKGINTSASREKYLLGSGSFKS